MESSKIVQAICDELIIRPTAIYYDSYEEKLISGATIAQKFLDLFSISISSAYEYMNKVEPATDQQTLAYKTATLARIAHLRSELAREANELTGQPISVNVGIHHLDEGQNPYYEAGRLMEGSTVHSGDGSTWVKFGSDVSGDIAVFGRLFPKAMVSKPEPTSKKRTARPLNIKK